jgi:hypothetical protein
MRLPERVDFGVRAGCTYHIAVDGPAMLFAMRVSQAATSSGPSLACPPTAGDDTLTGTPEPDVSAASAAPT